MEQAQEQSMMLSGGLDQTQEQSWKEFEDLEKDTHASAELQHELDASVHTLSKLEGMMTNAESKQSAERENNTATEVLQSGIASDLTSPPADDDTEYPSITPREEEKNSHEVYSSGVFRRWLGRFLKCLLAEVGGSYDEAHFYKLDDCPLTTS